MTSVEIVPVSGTEGSALCEPILRSVPEWFGIETSTRMYIADCARLPTWVARRDGAAAGFITLEMHFPGSAEVHCIAVRKEFHGSGVGTALVGFAEEHLRRAGVRYLQVKTQGPSKPNAEYARTLRFYEKCGFVALEEVQGLWPGIPCLILVKKL